MVTTAFWLLLSLSQVSSQEEARTFEFAYSDAPWSDVIKQVAAANNLTLRLDITPPGRFTYKDPKKFSPADALDLVHGVLLDRGITLLRRGGLIMTAQLGDDMPWELCPFVPVDKLKHVAPHEMVVTTLPIHSVSGDRVSSELELALSPRGKMVGNKVANRVVVYDRAGVCLQMLDLLSIIDPPIDPNGTRLRTYRLEHASVAEVEPIVREILGPQVAESKSTGGEMNPFDTSALTNVIFNRQFLESFTPGISMKGIGQETPKKKEPTRLAIDRGANTLLVVAEADTLAKIDQIVEAIDRPEGNSAAPTLIRSYPVSSGNGEEVATRLQSILGAKTDCTISGVDDLLIVRATAAIHAEVKLLLETLTIVDDGLAGFPLSRRRAEDLVPQLERLFSVDGQSAPRIVADTGENSILVRGTKGQIEQVRRMLIDLGEMSPNAPGAPRVRVGSPGSRRAVPSSR